MSFLQRDQYRKMFNGLQEGIIVIDDGVIIESFMLIAIDVGGMVMES